MIRPPHFWVFIQRIAIRILRAQIQDSMSPSSQEIETQRRLINKMWSIPTMEYYPSINKIWSIPAMEYYSAMKKEKTPPFGSNMDGL